MSAIGLHRLGLIVAAFVLQSTLLRAGLPGPDGAEARPSLVGQLLVAAPGVGNPRFERTVILIVEQGPDGALGIVINKPIGEQPLASVFQALGQKDGDAKGSVRVFSGGPVQPEVGFVVHSPEYRARDRRDYGLPFDDVKHGDLTGHRRQERASKGSRRSMVAKQRAGRILEIRPRSDSR